MILTRILWKDTGLGKQMESLDEWKGSFLWECTALHRGMRLGEQSVVGISGSTSPLSQGPMDKARNSQDYMAVLETGIIPPSNKWANANVKMKYLGEVIRLQTIQKLSSVKVQKPPLLTTTPHRKAKKKIL